MTVCWFVPFKLSFILRFSLFIITIISYRCRHPELVLSTYIIPEVEEKVKPVKEPGEVPSEVVLEVDIEPRLLSKKDRAQRKGGSYFLMKSVEAVRDSGILRATSRSPCVTPQRPAIKSPSKKPQTDIAKSPKVTTERTSTQDPRAIQGQFTLSCNIKERLAPKKTLRATSPSQCITPRMPTIKSPGNKPQTTIAKIPNVTPEGTSSTVMQDKSTLSSKLKQRLTPKKIGASPHLKQENDFEITEGKRSRTRRKIMKLIKNKIKEMERSTRGRSTRSLGSPQCPKESKTSIESTGKREISQGYSSPRNDTSGILGPGKQIIKSENMNIIIDHYNMVKHLKNVKDEGENELNLPSPNTNSPVKKRTNLRPRNDTRKSASLVGDKVSTDQSHSLTDPKGIKDEQSNGSDLKLDGSECSYKSPDSTLPTDDSSVSALRITNVRSLSDSESDFPHNEGSSPFGIPESHEINSDQVKLDKHVMLKLTQNLVSPNGSESNKAEMPGNTQGSNNEEQKDVSLIESGLNESFTSDTSTDAEEIDEISSTNNQRNKPSSRNGTSFTQSSNMNDKRPPSIKKEHVEEDAGIFSSQETEDSMIRRRSSRSRTPVIKTECLVTEKSTPTRALRKRESDSQTGGEKVKPSCSPKKTSSPRIKLKNSMKKENNCDTNSPSMQNNSPRARPRTRKNSPRASPGMRQDSPKASPLIRNSSPTARPFTRNSSPRPSPLLGKKFPKPGVKEEENESTMSPKIKRRLRNVVIPSMAELSAEDGDLDPFSTSCDWTDISTTEEDSSLKTIASKMTAKVTMSQSIPEKPKPVSNSNPATKVKKRKRIKHSSRFSRFVSRDVTVIFYSQATCRNRKKNI